MTISMEAELDAWQVLCLDFAEFTMVLAALLKFPTVTESLLGCGEKEFRCRCKARQPEPLSTHQSRVSAELNPAQPV